MSGMVLLDLERLSALDAMGVGRDDMIIELVRSSCQRLGERGNECLAVGSQRCLDAVHFHRPHLHAGHFGHRQVDSGELRDKRFGKRSEEHTSELQSLMRISYAVFCLKKKNDIT